MLIDIEYNGQVAAFKQNNETIYFGQQESIMRTKWGLYTKNKLKIATIRPIQEGWFSTKEKYAITIPENSISVEDFTIERLGNRWLTIIYYKAEIGNDTYEIVPHKGYVTSIFKNNQQIGYFECMVTTLGYVEKYKLIANSDFDLDILMLLVYTGILIPNKTTDAQFTVYLGNGTERQKFDEFWKPN